MTEGQRHILVFDHFTMVKEAATIVICYNTLELAVGDHIAIEVDVRCIYIRLELFLIDRITQLNQIICGNKV